MNINDITITSIETITCFGVTSGEYLFTLDELQSASIAQSQEVADITGRQGRRLNSLKRNKAITISGQNGMVSHGLLELQTGSSFTEEASKIMWTDYITVDTTNGTKTEYVAVGTAGAEIVGMYVHNSDGTLGVSLEQDSSVDEGKFTYDPTTRELEFYSDIENGTSFVAYYYRNLVANVLMDSASSYSGKCAMYIDAVGEDKCANIYHVQIYISKADFNGDFTFDMGDNQAVHSFEANALAGTCGNVDGFFTYTVFGADAEDYTGGDNLVGSAIVGTATAG